MTERKDSFPCKPKEILETQETSNPLEDIFYVLNSFTGSEIYYPEISCAGKFVMVAGANGKIEILSQSGENFKALSAIQTCFGEAARQSLIIEKQERKLNERAIAKQQKRENQEKRAKQAIASSFTEKEGSLFSRLTCSEHSGEENNLTHSRIVAAANLQEQNEVLGGGQFAVIKLGQQRVLICGGMSDEYGGPACWPEEDIKKHLKKEYQADAVIFCPKFINPEFDNKSLGYVPIGLGRIISTKGNEIIIQDRNFLQDSTKYLAKTLESKLLRIDKDKQATDKDKKVSLDFKFRELNKILADPTTFSSFTNDLKNLAKKYIINGGAQFIAVRDRINYRTIIFWGSNLPEIGSVKARQESIKTALQEFYPENLPKSIVRCYFCGSR